MIFIVQVAPPNSRILSSGNIHGLVWPQEFLDERVPGQESQQWSSLVQLHESACSRAAAAWAEHSWDHSSPRGEAWPGHVSLWGGGAAAAHAAVVAEAAWLGLPTMQQQGWGCDGSSLRWEASHSSLEESAWPRATWQWSWGCSSPIRQHAVLRGAGAAQPAADPGLGLAHRQPSRAEGAGSGEGQQAEGLVSADLPLSSKFPHFGLARSQECRTREVQPVALQYNLWLDL